MHQTHSNKAEIVNDKSPERIYSDAILTKNSSLALCVLTADCAPILIYEKLEKIIWCIHAGWKGAFTGIIENTIEKLKELNGKPQELVVSIGPCISQENYEIKNNTLYLNHSFNEVGDFDVFVKIIKSDSTKIISDIKEVDINPISIENITIPFSSNYLKAISNKIDGKYHSIENIETFLNLYTKNTSNYYNKTERYNVYTFQKYWLLLILLLVIEWYIRKTRGLVWKQ